MIDEYDLAHTSNFKKVVNIYSNYTQEQIEHIITEYVNEDFSNYPNTDSKNRRKIALKKELQEVIELSLKCLDVLEPRNITNVGTRIVNNEFSSFDDYHTFYAWTLIQVWRGSCFIRNQ